VRGHWAPTGTEPMDQWMDGWMDEEFTDRFNSNDYKVKLASETETCSFKVNTCYFTDGLATMSVDLCPDTQRTEAA